MAIVVAGDKWAAMECLSVYRGRVVTEENGVKESYTDWFIHLKCDCGKEEKMVQRTFLGKRRTLDCGCGAGDRKAELNKSEFVSLYLPRTELIRLKKWARAQELSVSKAAVSLLGVAFEELGIGADGTS